MGTSVNQRSAPSANWAVAQAGYRSEVPVQRVVQEIWRAATNQREGDLARLLAQPIVARLGQIAVEGRSPADVSLAATREVARAKGASLAADIAQRAAVQCVTAENRAVAYGQQVFVEACNYLLSRDLPGYVGGRNRNRTIVDSIVFKASILENTARIVNTAGRPDFSSEKGWRGYVETVVDHLKRSAK